MLERAARGSDNSGDSLKMAVMHLILGEIGQAESGQHCVLSQHGLANVKWNANLHFAAIADGTYSLRSTRATYSDPVARRRGSPSPPGWLRVLVMAGATRVAMPGVKGQRSVGSAPRRSLRAATARAVL
jgi:hypothetical protein